MISAATKRTSMNSGLAKRFLLLAVAFSIFSFSALESKAERVIGNGGGFAELKAIYLNQNLGGLFQTCAKAENLCQLDQNSFADFQRLLALDEKESASVEIRFSLHLPTPVSTRRELGDAILINSSLLYDEHGFPKPTQKIAALVLAGRWAHVSKLPLEQILIESQNLTASFSEISDSKSVGTLLGEAVVFHQARLQYAQTESVFVALEDKAQSLDLTTAVQSVLTCGAIEAWTFGNLRAFQTSTKLVLSLDATAACETRSKTLVIEVGTDSKGLIAKSIYPLLKEAF